MNRFPIVIYGLVCALTFTAQAVGSDDQTKPSVEESSVVTLRGTIEAVDKEAQTVTVKGSEGKSVTVGVLNPENLDVIKVGDPVVAKYYESLAIQVMKPGEGTPAEGAIGTMATNEPGETPARLEARQITVTRTVAAIDMAAETVTLKGPDGELKVVEVRDPRNLENVDVGDEVVITYTEAVAVTLEKQ